MSLEAENFLSSKAASFFQGGGEMGERIRSFDWSKTPLGPVESWSPALRMMVRFLLANRFPLLLWWGPQYASLYNDPYRPVLGTKHPWALGKPVRECWKEIWHILEPLIDTPFHGGPATWNDDILLELRQDNQRADESKQLRPSAFLPSSLALTRGRPFDAGG
jgi:hypothetical protein